MKSVAHFFLSMEAIGLNRFAKIYKFIESISDWCNRNPIKSLIFIIPPGALMILGFFLQCSILVALFFPVSILTLLFNHMIDLPLLYRKMFLRSVEDKTVGPLGFILLLIGNILFLISILGQM